MVKRQRPLVAQAWGLFIYRKMKGDKLKNVILIVLIICGLGAVIGGVVFGLHGDNDSSGSAGFVTPTSTPTSTPITVTDQSGRTVTLDAIPERIISISPANTEILFALGLGDKVVGVTNYCNYPEEALDKEKVGGFSTPDIEKIIALEPDVIFAAPLHEAEIIPQMENLGLKVIAITPENLDETYDAIEVVGMVTGTQSAAVSLVQDMQSRVGLVTGLVAGLSYEDRLNVFYIVWHDPLMTAGGDTLAGQLIELAGGRNIFANLSGYATVSIEPVIDAEPQIIIAGTGMGSGANAPVEWAESEPLLQDTEAIEEGKVFSINTDLTGRFGPRIVDALYEMLELIHPELASQLE